jgi:multiple sugar transport system substrate-binding protein
MERKLNRRQFLRASAGAAVGSLLAACAPKTVVVEKKETVVVEKEVEKVVTATPPPKGKVKIVYYDRHSDCEVWAEPYNAMQDAVEVEVQIQPPGTRYEQLMAAITAGNAPDVIGLDCVQVGRFAQLGALAPLEDAIAKETLDLFFPNLINVEGHYGHYGGHIVGVPFWVDNSVCFYNKTFLEEAGGDPEAGIRSWDDYINYGKAAVEAGHIGMSMLGSGGGIEFLYWPWIWAQGGDICNEDWTASTVDSPEVMNTFKFIRDMVTVHQVTNDAAATQWSEAFALFTSQKAMACHQGGGGVGVIRSEFPELWDVLGVCPIPGAKEGQKSSFIGGNVASMSMQSQEKEAALDFLVWVTASDDGIGVTGELGFLPGCPHGIDLPVYQKDPEIYEAYREGLTTGWPSSNNPHYDEVMVVLRVAFSDVALGEMPLEEIVDRAHGEVKRIVERV